jgi:integrase
MSVHKRANGRWEVKYRVAGRQRSRTFDRKGDADRFDAEVKRRSQLGPALARELDRTTLTFDGFVRDGFRTHAATLAKPTREKYAWALENHLSELADEPLLTLDVPRLAAHQRTLLDRGASASTVREVMARLSGVLQIAVEHGHLPANPVRGLRKVRLDPKDDVNPLSPVELERMLAALKGRDRAIVLLGGHLGLRPLEIRQVQWGAFDGVTLTIGRSRTKRTAARTRTITVPKATARELKEWRLNAGRPGDSEPIVGAMTQNAMKLWGRRVLRPAIKTASGREDASLYTLRHTHASALHYAGFTIPEAARRLGHGAALHVETYAHVVDSISGKRYRDLDALFAAARNDPMFAESSLAAAEAGAGGES